MEQRFEPSAYVEFNEASLAMPDIETSPQSSGQKVRSRTFSSSYRRKDSAEYLDQSLGSILLQAGDFELHVHVQDAASTDHTKSVVDRWRSWLEAAARKNIRLTFDSRPDREPLRRHHAGVRNFSAFRRYRYDVAWLRRCFDARRLGNGEVSFRRLSADQMANWIDLCSGLRRLQ